MTEKMTKSSSAFPASHEPQTGSSSNDSTTTKSQERSPLYVSNVLSFFERIGISNPDVKNYCSEDFYSDLISNSLKAGTVRRGHVTCFTTVKPPFDNFFGALHGGVVAAIAERVAIATARTVVGEDKDIFLGELAISYLSSAMINDELIVDGSVTRSGKNLSVIAIEFKIKKTGKLVYNCRATFYNSPTSKL